MMETRMKNKETVTTHISPGCMDEISLADAEGIVEAYTTRRVIIQGDMSTSQILATNEVSQVMLCFDRIEETSYQKWADIFGLSFEDFQKMDLRVVTVLEAEKVAKTKKLLKLKVNTGVDTREIVSGIAEYYEPQDLIGKQVLMLINLAPKNIKGVDSHGMVLMAENADGALSLMQPQKTVKEGSTVK
jgi:methionine--tRNA ligase beta chain